MNLLYVGESSKGNCFFKTELNWYSCSKETWERHQKEIEVVGDARDGIFDAPLNIFNNYYVKLVGMTLEKQKITTSISTMFFNLVLVMFLV